MGNMSANSLLFTTYYSTKALPVSSPLYPNFHDISVNNVYIEGGANVSLTGFAANTGNTQKPLTLTLNNVVTDSPSKVNVFSSDANLTLTGLVNLPVVPSNGQPDKCHRNRDEYS